MKIIDLLNKIANGEEAPKKIKYDGEEYKITKVLLDDNKYYSNYINEDMVCIFPINTNCLNDEVEILDDEEKGLPKKLEHLNVNYLNDENNYTKEELVLDITTLQNWINKLIDYLEKQRKGE